MSLKKHRYKYFQLIGNEINPTLYMKVFLQSSLTLKTKQV